MLVDMGNTMSITYCEIFTRYILPSIRALIAKKLINEYGYTQWSAAKRLGVSQALINHYIYGKRGTKLFKILESDEHFMGIVNDIARSIAMGKASVGEILCRLCIDLRTRNRDIIDIVGIRQKDVSYPPCFSR